MKFVGKRYKGAVHVPEGTDLETAIKIYNQGYGHALRNVIRTLREEGTPIDTHWLGPHVASMRKTDRIHIVQSSGEKANET